MSGDSKIRWSALGRIFLVIDAANLVKGDSDFNYLVVRLRHKGKRVLVFSTKYHIARELIASCTKYFDIIDFKDEFFSKKIARLLQRAV